ncbi:hypothetical protein LJR225_002952 [Phenylobacterium sp. LjRoot225]|uniref:hypothetical protein n=1 Tax=Phenylobacterium sp. LjRoot225 TaxID=3342285 RepID=UPI003ED0B8DA
MGQYTWIVFTNCNDPEHEAEFIQWYDDVHLADLLNVPGIVGARRLKLSDVQVTRENEQIMICDIERSGAKYQNVAFYEIEAEAVRPVLDEIVRRAGGPQMALSPYLGEVNMIMYERR